MILLELYRQELLVVLRRRDMKIMTKIKLSNIDKELTEAELLELAAAEKKEQVYDEDSPRMTTEQLLEFKRLNRTKRIKQTVSLRLSANTVDIAKSYGKGYTSFLSRLIEVAIRDKQMVEKCL